MKKLLEQTFLWFSCINPCIQVPVESSKHEIMVECQNGNNLDSFLYDLEKLYDTVDKANLPTHNYVHLVAFKDMIMQFKIGTMQNEKKLNLLPAFKKLLEALEDDNLIWKKYSQENKISELSYTQHTNLKQQLKNYIGIKTKIA
jgi:hypothetical protein